MTRTYTLREPTGGTPSRIDYAQALNEQQLAVVEAGSGALLVLAGAGTGKTRTITYRVARLIERGVAPERILLLTFTNRAAREMTDRVGELLHADARRVQGGTFHGVARRLIREHAAQVGLTDSFGILDGDDCERLMKQVIAETVKKTPDSSRFPSAGTALGMLSRALNTGRDAEELIAADHPHFAHWSDALLACFAAYQSRKGDLDLVDFDDLLLIWHRLMHDDGRARAAIAARFEHILVDEYQDTNRLQSEIVDAVALGHGNLTVVGDDFQSIYSFRGADFRNILEFEERHPGTRRYLLTINYRSSPQILDVANLSIAHNERQFAKELSARQPEGPLPAWVRCRDEVDQNRFVAQRVLDLRDEGVSLDKMAVLYRAHYQSMELQLELNRRGIPFVVRSGQRFFEQRHIKDVLAFLRFVENPRDELALQRILEMGDGLGPATARKIYDALRAVADLRESLRGPAVDRVVPSRGRPSWILIRDLLVDLTAERLRTDSAAAIEQIVDRVYDAYAQRSFDNAPNRLRELEMLTTYASRHGSVHEFLDSLALATDLAGVETVEAAAPDEQLVLSSVHQAKGLEFHAVFLIGMVDEQFPSARSIGVADDIEEERRLFYVATTRAERELYATVPAIGWDRAKGPVIYRPSRFLTEVKVQRAAAFETWELSVG